MNVYWHGAQQSNTSVNHAIVYPYRRLSPVLIEERPTKQKEEERKPVCPIRDCQTALSPNPPGGAAQPHRGGTPEGTENPPGDDSGRSYCILSPSRLNQERHLQHLNPGIPWAKSCTFRPGSGFSRQSVSPHCVLLTAPHRGL